MSCVYRMVPGDMRPPRDPFASWLGRIRVALPTEVWPSGKAGPLEPLCQVNTVELPERPDLLRDIALVAVFDAGEVRAYSSLAELIPFAEAARGAHPKPIHWDPCDDPGVEGNRIGGDPTPGIPREEFVLQILGEMGLYGVARCGEEWRLVAADR